MSSPAPILKLLNVSKAYKGKGKQHVQALNKVSFTVPQGVIFCILGPNGAGKSTLLKLLATLSEPDSGELFFESTSLKKDPLFVRQRLGVVFQQNHFNPYLSIKDNLFLHGAMHGLSKAAMTAKLEPLLEEAGLLKRWKEQTPEQLSGGQKRRLAIIRALMHEPSLLLLDEPSTGLDPDVRMDLWKQVLALKAEGKTVILTTHYMEEAEHLSDHILLMQQGEVMGQGTPAQVKSLFLYEERFDLCFKASVCRQTLQTLANTLAQLPHVEQAELEALEEGQPQGIEHTLSLKLSKSETETGHAKLETPPVLGAVFASVFAVLPSAALLSAAWQLPTLESVFLNLAQNQNAPLSQQGKS
jgi:ABC-type multidrug transport system ATPase subunit